MTVGAVALLAGAGVFAVFDWWSVASDHLGVEYVAKPLVIVMLVGVALAVDTGDDIARGLVIAALGASLVGDVVLIAPDASFEGGLGAFLIAHLLYVLAMIGSVQRTPALVGAVVMVVAVAVLAPPVVRSARRKGLLSAVAVASYVVAVSATALVAIGTAEVVAVAGGSLFLASDALLGWDRFVGATPGGRVLVHVTYHLGQAGLVSWLAA